MHKNARKGFAALAALSVLVPGVITYAQETGTPPPVRPVRALLDNLQDRREDRREDRQEAHSELEDIRRDALDDRKELRDETRDAMRNASSTDDKKDILRGALTDRLQIVRDRIASTTAVKRDLLKDIVMRHFGASKARFELALTHLDSFLARIDARIDKMQENGIDTSAADGALAEAESAIADAKAAVRSLVEAIESVQDTDDKSAVRETIQAATKHAVEAIKEAQKQLKEVVRILLDIAKENRDTESTTN